MQATGEIKDGKEIAIKDELRGVFRLAQEKEQSHLQVLDRVSVKKKTSIYSFRDLKRLNGLKLWKGKLFTFPICTCK